jgi:plastocyanin
MVMVGPGGSHSFAPSKVTIHPGDTVQWVWGSNNHTVTSGDPSTGAADNQFCSPSDTNCSGAAASDTGAMYSHTFTQAGTFPYFCVPHRRAGMTGSVVVQ